MCFCEGKAYLVEHEVVDLLEPDILLPELRRPGFRGLGECQGNCKTDEEDAEADSSARAGVHRVTDGDAEDQRKKVSGSVGQVRNPA